MAMRAGPEWRAGTLLVGTTGWRVVRGDLSVGAADKSCRRLRLRSVHPPRLETAADIQQIAKGVCCRQVGLLAILAIYI